MKCKFIMLQYLRFQLINVAGHAFPINVAILTFPINVAILTLPINVAILNVAITYISN